MADAILGWPELTQKNSYTSPRHYRTQDPILFQGEIPPSALIVSSGFVVSYTINNNGDEQIIGFFAAGDVIPIEWIFGRCPVSLYYYRAFTDCSLVSVNRNEFLDQIKSTPGLASQLLEKFVSGYIGATVHIHALEHSHSREKLIKLFHYLVLRFGVQDTAQSGMYTIPFPLTHAQLASMIGLTRETVAMETVKLKKLGAINYKRGEYTINLSVLIQSVGSEEFDALQL